MDIGKDKVSLTPPESEAIWNALTLSKDENVRLLKYRLETARATWAQDKLKLSMKETMSRHSVLIFDAAASDWTETDGNVVRMNTSKDELQLIARMVTIRREIDYGDIISSPESIARRERFEAEFPEEPDEKMSDEDRAVFESDEFEEKLKRVAMGSYILEQIEKHLTK